MKNIALIQYRPCTDADRVEIADLLYSTREELYFEKRTVALEITNLLFERGGIMGGFYDDKLIAIVGYFFGQAADNYTDKTTALIYVACVHRKFRSSGMFAGGLLFVMQTLQTLGVSNIRLHALETDRRLNAIYSTFAAPLRTELNRRGICCVLYGNTVAQIIQLLETRLTKRCNEKMDHRIRVANNQLSVAVH